MSKMSLVKCQFRRNSKLIITIVVLGGSGSSNGGQGGARPSSSQQGTHSSAPSNNTSKITYSKANSIDGGVSRTNHSHSLSSDIADAHSAASIGKILFHKLFIYILDCRLFVSKF